MALGVKTGGRKKGSKNKAPIERAKAIAKSGKTPLDYMLGVMRNPKGDPEMRLDAAKSAAPYVHAKLASIELAGKNGKPIEVQSRDATEVARKIAYLLAQGLAAK